jgi:hypothetical protein
VDISIDFINSIVYGEGIAAKERHMSDTQATDLKVKKERSPSFPFISLRKAVERAGELLEAHKRSPARLVTVAPTWGYAPKSSGLLQTAAALKQYGLIDDLGGGDDRKIQLTDLASRILLDTRPGAREQALKEAALSSKLISEYANQWVSGRPSDSHCLSELHLDRGFTPDAARVFLRVFDETVSFANLRGDDSTSDLETESEQRQDEETTERDHIKTEGIASPARAAMRANSQRATFPLPEGLAALELPTGALSRESYEDLRAWIDVMLRRAQRSAGVSQPQSADAGSNED